MSATSIWDQVLGRIESKVGHHSFHTWFKPTSMLVDDGARVSVQVPNLLFTEWLPKHYSVVLAEALKDVGRPNTELVFVSGESTSTSPPSPVVPRREPDDNPVTISAPAGLNPRYTFDTFIVGPSNQFADAACRAVAEVPSRSYNPLFIYGAVGLGKTHLMHAIGQYVLQHSPGLKLTYISSERFMNEMINAVRFDRILDFRERYRTVDVLLVDDIQFVSGKEGTQNEFFHTFNALHDA
ncbi:MAG: DnaA ATPase domain-containing protein, partial [Vicinamibacterales bacterium]